MPQTSPCKLEYILNPIYPSKDKEIKNANKLNTIKERNNTKKTSYSVHDLEVGDKSTSGKWYSKSLTCVIASGVLILIDSPVI